MSVLVKRVGETTFRFEHAEFGVELVLRNARQEDGHTYGDLYAYARMEQGAALEKLLVRPKANLTSSAGITSLGKSLLDRHPHYDWRTLLETVCVQLVEALDRRGIVTELSAMDPKEIEQPFLFRRFAPLGLVSAVIAHGGTGKSLTAGMLAISVATGMTVGPFEPLKRGPVLYADWENEADLHRRRLTRMCMGLGIAFPSDIIHYAARGKLAHAEAEMAEIAAERGVVLTILDSIGFAAGGNLNDNDVATQAVNVLKHLPGTKIMVAHVSKSAIDRPGSQGATGSVFFWNGPQASYSLVPSDQELDGSVVLTIFYDKANVSAKYTRPLGVRVQFEDPAGPISVEGMEIRGDSAGGERLAPQVRVRDALRYAGRTLTAENVCERLWPDSDVRDHLGEIRTILTALTRKGEVVQVGEKPPKYGLAAREEPAPAPAVSSIPEAPSDFVCWVCLGPATRYDPQGRECCDDHFE
jgi:hypothetical protein